MNQPSPEPAKTLLGTTRSTPSAPRPRRRSHSAWTRLSVRSSVPSGSGSSTKSFSVPCPLTNSIPTRSEYRADGLGQVGASAVEPGDALITPEPGPLPPNEATGGAGDLGGGGLDVVGAVEVGEHLLVAEGPRGGEAVTKAKALQGSDLVDEPGLEHELHPKVDPGVQVGDVTVDADLHGPVPRLAPLGHGRGERPAGELDDLQGPHHAPPVRRQDGCRRNGV